MEKYEGVFLSGVKMSNRTRHVGVCRSECQTKGGGRAGGQNYGRPVLEVKIRAGQYKGMYKSIILQVILEYFERKHIMCKSIPSCKLCKLQSGPPDQQPRGAQGEREGGFAKV